MPQHLDFQPDPLARRGPAYVENASHLALGATGAFSDLCFESDVLGCGWSSQTALPFARHNEKNCPAFTFCLESPA
jgi:hypothetical protein